MSAATPAGRDTATSLRHGLLGLAGAGIVFTGLELVAIHHWENPAQLIPWVALSGITATLLLVVARPHRSTVLVARATGLLLAATGVYGVVDHISSNVSAGPLDAQYGPRWDTMSTIGHWWAAANGGVGPAPALAPLVLAQIGICLALATVGHPALERRPRVPADAPPERSVSPSPALDWSGR